MKKLVSFTILSIIMPNVFGINIEDLFKESMGQNLSAFQEIFDCYSVYLSEIDKMKREGKFDKANMNSLFLMAAEEFFADERTMQLFCETKDGKDSFLINSELRNEKGESPLLLTIKTGNFKTTKFLLERGFLSGCKQQMVLDYVLESRNQPIMSLLIRYGLNIDFRNKKKRDETPLMAAAREKSIEKMRFLLSNEADFNIKNKNGKNVLSILASDPKSVDDNLQAIELLLKYGMSLDEISESDENSKIVKSKLISIKNKVEKERSSMTQCLISGKEDVMFNGLKKWKDINAPISSIVGRKILNEMGTLPVLNFTVTLVGNDGVEFSYFTRKLLEEFSVNVNKKDRIGRTSLMKAVEFGLSSNVCKLLEKSDIDLNVKTENGWTALMLAIDKGQKEIAEKLLEKEDIDINIQNKSGWTALMFAAYEGYGEIVSALLKQKDKYGNRIVKINEQNETGNTALMVASYMGHHEVVQILLNADGIDIDFQNKYGWTALMIASRQGHGRVVDMFLRKGAKITSKSNDNLSALTLAVVSSNYGIADVLLSKYDKDSIREKDEFGRTSLYYAIEMENLDIIKKILDKYEKISEEELDNKDVLGETLCSLAWNKKKIRKLLLKYISNEVREKKLRKKLEKRDSWSEKVKQKAIAEYGEVSRAFEEYSLKGMIPEMEALIDGDFLPEETIYQAFRVAAECGNTNSLDLLLKKYGKIDINYKYSQTRDTALILAAKNGKYDAVVSLVANGATITAENKDKDTALTLAAINGHVDVVRYLCAVGVKSRNAEVALKRLNDNLKKFRKKWNSKKNSKDKMPYEQIQKYLKDQIVTNENEESKEEQSFKLKFSRSVYFNSKAENDWENWMGSELFERVKYLVTQIKENPYKRGATLGSLEGLKGKLEGLFSRRINDEHRLVYRVIDEDVYVVSCNGHYDNVEEKTTKELFKNISSSFKKEWMNGFLIDMN